MTFHRVERIVGAKALTEYRYKAFISYSHADEKEGDWLHRALERYVAPKNLVGKTTPVGPVPRKLTPIFRDKEDLPAAGNLNDTIIEALKNSQFLIVLASPNAAQSKWVREEIRQFKAFHGPDRVLAIIIDGEPHASDDPALDDALECFPDTLRYNEDETGARTHAEPLAADARLRAREHGHTYGRDGRAAAITKLVAGLAGVTNDDLVQREAQRRMQRARQIAAASVSAVALMGAMTFYADSQRREAQTQRNEAQRMRGEAEGLIDFMITDVRSEVERVVGKLDTLETLGDRALEYYDGQDKTELDDNALGRRARALHFAGEVDRQRNNLDAALAAYEEAAATTEEILERDPENPDRIFEHAQSVFYVGDLLNTRGDLKSAEKHQTHYLRLAEQLVEIDPNSPKWRLELAYATSNLGALKFQENNFQPAIDLFKTSVEARRVLLNETEKDPAIAEPYAYSLSWLAHAQLAQGHFHEAIKSIDKQLKIYELYSSASSKDFSILDAKVTAQRRLAWAYLSLGDQANAEKHADKALAIVNTLLDRDPDNGNWLINASHIEILHTELAQINNSPDAQKLSAIAATKHARMLFEKDRTNAQAKIALSLSLSKRVESGSYEPQLINELISLNEELFQSNSDGAITAFATSSKALLGYFKAEKNTEKATAISDRAIKKLSLAESKMRALTKLLLLELYLESNKIDEARKLAADLQRTQMKHPTLASINEKLSE